MSPSLTCSILRLRKGLLFLAAAVALLALSPLLKRAWAQIDTKPSGADNQKAAGDESPYDHFLYVRYDVQDGTNVKYTLVVVKATAEEFQQREIPVPDNMFPITEPLCAHAGKLYLKMGFGLLTIDLTSGKLERIDQEIRNVDRWTNQIPSATYQFNLLYALVSQPEGYFALRQYDFSKGAYRNMANISSAFPVGAVVTALGNPLLSVSPDGKKMAKFKVMEREEKAPSASYMLHLINLDDALGKVSAVGPKLALNNLGDGPSFVWVDSHTILLLRDASEESLHKADSKAYPDTISLIDITTGKLTDVITLPRWQSQGAEPLWPFLRPPEDDNVPRIVFERLGQYRIDLNNKKLVEDNTYRGGFKYFNERKPKQFYCDKQLLAKETNILFSVSLDGQRAIWWTKDFEHPSSDLNYYDARQQTIRLVRHGRIVWPELEDYAIRSKGFWFTSADLTPAPAAEPPPGWQRWTSTPFPDPTLPKASKPDVRPNLADLFSLSLSTDKKVYKHFEPVQLTLTLTNKSKQDISFPRPFETSPEPSYFYFTMTSPHAKTGINEFSSSKMKKQDLFTSNPVVIKTGNSLQWTRTIEPFDLGEHKISGKPNGWWGSQFQGTLAADAITFVVEKSPDEAALLQAKFNRLIAQFRKQYEKYHTTPLKLLGAALGARMNKPPDDVYLDAICKINDMGADVVPLVVKELEASKESEYRRYVSQALWNISNDDVLPYFQKLLQGDMQADRQMVLDELHDMIMRGQTSGTPTDKALALLISAAKHPNEQVRHDAVALLTHFRDPKIKEAFETILDDADGTRAASYLAANEGLDLADWLSAAAEKPTHARYLAAAPIIKELENTWKANKGQMPKIPWEEAKKDSGAMEQFSLTVRAWASWARENPRYSGHYFETEKFEQQWITRKLESYKN
jgi:hypothetical protein